MRPRTWPALLLVAATASAASPQDAPGPPPRPVDERPADDTPDLASEKASRRLRAAEAIGAEGVLLVLSPAQVDGVPGSNRNTDFEYLSPLAPREAALLVAAPRDTEASPVDRVYLPLRNPATERWTGPEPGADAATAARAKFAEARAIERLADDVAAVLRTRGILRVSGGPPGAAAPMLRRLLADLRTRLPDTDVEVADGAGAVRDALLDVVRSGGDARDAAAPPASPGAPGASPPAAPAAPGGAPDRRRVVRVVSARPLLAEMREVKSPAEIQRIRAAVEGTVAGHFDAMRAARAGLFEYHLAAIVEFRCRAGGSLRQAYPSIVGSGPWSCVLHYDRNTRRLEDGDLVVLDAGGQYEGYASDVTRTFPVSGRFTEDQAAVYDAVLDAQERAIAAVKPGVTLRRVHEVARAALAERGLDKWFLHGTCHSVGLDVHDPWRKDAVLRPGSVLTVEPGVYDASRNLGVRIEDTVVVTEDGCEVLSASLPKRRAAVESLMHEDPPAGLPK